MGQKYIFDIETTGLDFPENRIISIAIKDVDTGESRVFIDVDEGLILNQFWSAITDAEELIGFNNMDFDLPALIQRSVVRGVKIKKPRKVIDLRKEVAGFWYSYNKMTKGTLKLWSELLGNPIKTNSGEQMVQLWIKGEYELVKAHNLEDVELTFLLYKRMKECQVI